MRDSLLKTCVISLLFFFQFSLAQQQQEILGSTLWIKNQEQVLNSANTEEMALKNYFNFNPVIDFSKSGSLKTIKNIVNKQSSLFVVFKSSEDQENGVLSIERPGFKAFLTNKNMRSDTEVSLKKVDSKKGVLLTYIVDKNSLSGRKKGKLRFDDLLFSDREGKNQMMELVYFPTCVNDQDKNKIESYLSIKYGISLIGDKDYLDSQGKKIWNFKNNSSFNYRVTGLGRDDFFGLNQKQSGNSEKDGLYMGLSQIKSTNSRNKETFSNQSFVLWGDNNLSTLIEKNDGNVKKMARAWKLVAANWPEKTKTQLLLNGKEMIIGTNINGTGKAEIKEDDFLWMVIDDVSTDKINYTTARYIKAATENDNFIFSNIEWNSTNTLFSFVKAPDFFIQNDVVAADCKLDQNAKARIKIIGGEPPYSIQISSDGFKNQLTSADNFVSIDNLQPGSYSLMVSDNSKKTQVNTFLIDPFENNDIRIATQWYLDTTNEVKLIPSISNTAGISSFSWSFNNQILSTEKEMLARKPGIYTLTITNTSGCSKEFKVEVLDKQKPFDNQWVVYPNPANFNEKFSIRFNLQESSNVSVAIYDISGRKIMSKNLGLIKDYTIQEQLSVSGTYLVTVNKNNVTSSTRLIIK